MKRSRKTKEEAVAIEVNELRFELEFNQSEAKNIDNSPFIIKKSKRKIANLKKKIKKLENSLRRLKERKEENGKK